MIHTDADDGQAQGQVDAFDGIPFLILPVVGKTDQLQRDVALIVIHADNDIIPAAPELAVQNGGTVPFLSLRS